MGYNNGGYGGNNRPKFEPKPGSGSLFPKQQKKSQNDPDWDGYFIADRAIQAGEKIKLVGWDKASNQGSFITLKPGREQQPQQGGYQPQGGYQQPQQGGYRQAPPQQYNNPNGNYQQNGNGYPPPQQGYSNPNPTYGNPNQALPLQPGFPPAGQQARGYVPPATTQGPPGQYVPPGPNGNQAPPPDHEDLPF